MKKLIIGAALMLLPILMLGQESAERALQRAAEDRAVALELLRMRNSIELKAQGNRIIKQLWPPPLTRQEPPTRYETERAFEEMKDDMKRELRREAWRLQFQMEEELRMDLRMEQLFRDIYRPRRTLYNFTIMEPFKPWRWVTIWDNNR